MDCMSSEERSLLMARIRSRDTSPELIVRRLVHGMGFRFRLHQKDLPGKPDLVLARHKCILLVHGCFWHRHGCALSSKPKTNSAYWEEKIAANIARDARNTTLLQELGWRVKVIWECETRRADVSGLAGELRSFITSRGET
jgi:DNA mismatch endonuclease, patch repair protein